jgi:hypothetical protein
MAKIAMACPFTHHVCTECPIFRGRHFYLCLAKALRGSEWEMTRYSIVAYRNSDEKHDKTFGMPTDISLSSAVISNVEDLIESEDFAGLKERRET